MTEHINSRRLLALVLLLFVATTGHTADTLSHGRFKDVTIYRPNGPVRQFVLFLSGDGGWQSETARMAQVLTGQGALVAGIDTQALFSNLERDGGACVFPDGDLENLSHYVQAYYRLPTYLTPVLVGYSAGASLAYAIGAQAPSGLFAGVLTLGFSADMELAKPLCKGKGIHFRTSADGKVQRLLPAARLPIAWVNLTGDRDRVCPVPEARAFLARVPGAQMIVLPRVDHYYLDEHQWAATLRTAFAKVSAHASAQLPSPPVSLADLPVVEVPTSLSGDRFAVLLSGDGGWAGIDKEVARALADRGIPVAGLDTLRYFWSARTPEGLARDLDRTLRYYASHWHKSQALLIGYSQGADVLPFAVNRLPPATRAMVALTTMIGLGKTAAFEFHLSNWLGSADGLQVLPEVERLPAASTLCVYGRDDASSLCAQLGPTHARVVELPGGHHFGGDYDAVARLILQQLGAASGARG
jgi:type IV secretory pathway VirJ component